MIWEMYVKYETLILWEMLLIIPLCNHWTLFWWQEGCFVFQVNGFLRNKPKTNKKYNLQRNQEEFNFYFAMY